MMLPRKEVACFVEMQQIAYNKTHKANSFLQYGGDTDFASAHGMKQQIFSSTQQAISSIVLGQEVRWKFL